MAGVNTAALDALAKRTAQNSNAGTVGAIATGGHAVSAGIVASGAYTAFQTGGMTALRCFAGRVAAPLAGAMAGAWIAEKVHADDALLSAGQKLGILTPLAGPSNKAAHLKHQIAHSNAFWGALGGLVAGIVVGVAVAAAAAAIIGTAGMAAPLVGMAVAFGAGAVGGFVGTAIAGAGAKSATLSGPISSGSRDTYFENFPAARVTDTAACTKHPGSPPSEIIYGSKTVFINDLPMARVGHKLSCDAVVQEGCETVLGDDTTVAYGTPDADLSIGEQLLLSTVEVLGMRSAVREGGVLDRSLRDTFGEPVDVVTGEFVDKRTDFEFPGVLPLHLRRTYPGRMNVEGLLGPRWICNWSQRLVFDTQRNTVLLEDEDGQRLVFALPEGEQPILSTHLRAPYYRLTGTRAELRLFDSRAGHFLVFQRTSDMIGAMVAIEDRNGNRIDFLRDRDGHLARIVHSDGAAFRVTTTAEGLIHTLTMEGDDQLLVQYDYDAAGRIERAWSAFANTLHYRYTPEGWLAGWRDHGATQVEIAYDSAGRVIGTRASDGLFDDRFEYRPEERMSRYIDATGAMRSFWYNDNNLVVREEDPLDHVTLREWDGLDRLLAYTDQAGRVIRFTYDRDGFLSGRIDWAGRSQAWVRDAWGALLRYVAADGAVNDYRYDPRGNLIEWSRDGEERRRIAYDGRGRLVRETAFDGATVSWGYDSHGRPAFRRDQLGHETIYSFDRFGRMSKRTDRRGETTWYDYTRSAVNPRGAIHRIGYPDGGQERFEYDAEGMLALMERGEGQVTRYFHGAFDLPRRIVDAAGCESDFHYDGAGRLTGITDAAGKSWEYRYDAAGRLASEIDWGGRATLYRRDPVGRLVAKRLPDGAEQHFDWDERDRIVRVTAGASAIAYGYDDADRMVRAETLRLRAEGEQVETSVHLIYDAKGRLVGEIQNGIKVDYLYDAKDRLIGRKTPSGETMLTFDGAGLLRSFASNGRALHFERDAGGLETRRQVEQIGGHTAFALEQSYDRCGRLSDQRAGRLHEVTPGAAARPSAEAVRHFDWDRSGRLAGIDDLQRGQTRYRYDPRDQVIAVERGRDAAIGNEAYRYDTLMNLAESLSGEHRYWRDCVVQAGPNSYRYDARGRMTERVAVENGFRPRRWSYEWDALDRLIGLETPEGQRWRYVYDAFGRRVRKEMRKDQRCSRTDYLWDGAAMAEAWRRPGAGSDDEPVTVERWHFEPTNFRPLAKEVLRGEDRDGAFVAEQGDFYPIVTDHLGTPKEMFDGEGECLWRATHELWGRARTSRAIAAARGGAPGKEEGIDCALRFPNQWADEESGLHYNLNRYYDPETGQYLSPDPIGLAGGARTHAYVHDPMQWFDPLGLAACASARDVITRGPNGEILNVKGTIKPEDIGTGTKTNASSREQARSLGRSTDDAGHTRAQNLGGSGGKDYVWPQDPHYNRGQFRDFEGDIADHVSTTQQPVNFEQSFDYANGGTRPTGVNYTVTDMQGNPLFQRYFSNP
jgi:RHS repeat-associated protein